MKETTFWCDRCHKRINGYNEGHSRLWIASIPEMNWDRTLDLCDTCKKQLDNFLKGWNVVTIDE